MRTALGTAMLVLALAAAADARTIRGTDGADTLRGSPAADVIDGRGGDDRIFGRGGNDRLVGGAGADRLVCGAGRDRVVADHLDQVARDCEAVRFSHHDPPPLPPAEPPRLPYAVPGHYVARSEQARYVHLDVYPDGRLLTNLRVEYDADCTPTRAVRGPFVDIPGDFSIAADRTFALETTAAAGRLQLTMRATFGTDATLVGNFRVRLVIEDGTRYECDSGPQSFRGGRLARTASRTAA